MTDFIIDLMVIIWLTILVYLFLSELYFRSRRFKAIKRKIDTYTKECNELNDHIEALYSITKKMGEIIGVKVTKAGFAKGVSKAVPIVGGVIV